MDSVLVTWGIGFKGRCVGVAASPSLETSIGKVFQHSGNIDKLQLLDLTADPLVIAAGATVVLDLVTGQKNPLNEDIASADAFDSIQVVMLQHDKDSEASTITVMGGASAPFQGPWSASDKATLAPRRGIAYFTSADDDGWDIDGTTAHKIAIVNDDVVNDATVNIYVEGLKA